MIAANSGEHAQNELKLHSTRLWASADLDAADREALVQACSDIRTVGAGTDLLRQDAHANAVHILLEGWAARYKIMREGSRFISMLAVPGDVCDLDALRFDRLNYGVTMLSAGSVALLPRQRANTLIASHPAISNAFWSVALTENTILTERAASIARRSATLRVAHLLCELLLRLTAVGKAEGQSYNLPLTQEQIADTLGLTAVHLNRTLHSLRSMKLVTMQNRRVVIHDWQGLSALCGFRPDYLRLETNREHFNPELTATSLRDQNVVPSPLHSMISI